MNNKSVFDPKFYKNFNPNRMRIYTFKAGFKKKLDDLLIIVFEKSINFSVIFSKTTTPSAPIIWNKKNMTNKCRAIIVNAGNANAHTGDTGIKIINKYVNQLSKEVKCDKNEILVSSTGVIGEIFDHRKITNKIKNLNDNKKTDILSAAKSIMTTDTYPKTSVKKFKIGSKIIRIYGFAKGSGMISPNMGTMLAYIFIEANLNSNQLKKIIQTNVENTFNSITVDSDTSTSDTLCLFSIGDQEKFGKKDLSLISKSVNQIMEDLSLQIIKDGEGISKLIKVNIQNCKNVYQAKNVGLNIANSLLVKTAISGEDANWGRVIMAIGKSYEKINPKKIKIYFGKNLVCENGAAFKRINIKKLDKYMKNKIIEITVDLSLGNKSKTIYGNDLTHEYIRINGDYRS